MYIYLDREEAKKGFALVLGTSETKIEDYKNHYEGKAIEYIGDDIPHYITYVEASDTIREATESEKLERNQITLEDNQVIIDNQIYTYDKKYQKVVDNKIIDKTLKELLEENLITLDEIKEQKREKLKNIRDEEDNSDIEVNGDLFKIKKDDVMKFYLIGIGIGMGLVDPKGKERWVLADNTVKEFTNNELMNVIAKKAERERTLFRKFIELDERLKQARTVEEIENVVWY